jgi:predicted peptidase
MNATIAVWNVLGGPAMLGLVILGLLGATLGLGACAAGPGERGDAERGALPRIEFDRVEVGGATYPYVVMLPAGYDPSAASAWPAILFLHGRGESGTNASRPLVIGLPQSVLYDWASWPAVVIVPQKPDQETQWEDHAAAVEAILSRVMRERRIDPDRVVLTGMSQGGHGCWTIGARMAGTFAAIAPVCGYVFVPERTSAGERAWRFDDDAALVRDIARGIGRTPVWALHGEADSVVPVEQTTRMIEALRSAGADVRVTTYPGVNHNSWEKAYADAELRAWMLAARRR